MEADFRAFLDRLKAEAKGRLPARADATTRLAAQARAVRTLRLHAESARKHGQLENAFCFHYRLAWLVLRVLPSHPEYNERGSIEQELIHEATDAMNIADELKVQLQEHFLRTCASRAAAIVPSSSALPLPTGAAPAHAIVVTDVPPPAPPSVSAFSSLPSLLRAKSLEAPQSPPHDSIDGPPVAYSSWASLAMGCSTPHNVAKSAAALAPQSVPAGGNPALLRRLVVPMSLMDAFAHLAAANTCLPPRGIETCGVLAGYEVSSIAGAENDR